ncbi:QRFP-like peptide receptor isoform X1 [Diorhabda sublineata]|uniref:QRFP-like peptide receptor isoform X1 n=1 Tax=Diorhabda sublineata TaxID=1163346 RepID=UPI0024E11888|nr:QRFP-like peptide receptor isoform X1 [Diorhabda sublineata]
MISTTTSLSTTSVLNATPLSITDINATTSNYLYSPSALDVFNITNNVTNFTEGIYPVFPSYIRTTSMVFCIIIMCLGVIGNVMVPIVIFKTKDMRNSTNIFLVNLSVADLMVLLVCTPTVLVEVNSIPETWVLGREMCKAVPFVELTVAHASVLTILAISFERYYAICKPLKAGYICTKARASLICLLAWFVAAVFTSPIIGIAEFKHIEYFDGTKVPACHTLANTFWSALYFLGSVFLFFIVPLLLLIVLYFVIAKNLISNAATLVLNKHIDNYSIRARRQVIMMLGTVVLSFFLCLIPFRVFIIWIIVVPEESVIRLGIEKYYNILYFCRIMVYLNSAVNPILYNLMSSKFRHGFVICSDTNRHLFRRARNGTTSTTATRSSSTLRNSQDSYNYRVCYRPKNIIKGFSDSPGSNKSSDSHSVILKDVTASKNRSLKNSSIDEEYDDFDLENHENPDYNVFTEKVIMYSQDRRHEFKNFYQEKCYREKEGQINLQEKIVKRNPNKDDESFV